MQDFLASQPGVEPGALADAVAAAREGSSGAPKRWFRMIRTTLANEAAPRGSPGDDALLE